MIISHKYKFIFIKTLKTASTSIEIGLSSFCGKSDIITPLIPEDEKKRQELSLLGAQNFVLKWPNWNKRDYLYFLKYGKVHQYGGHCSAKFIKNHVSKKVWNNYYKFCFDRNPWDKAISYYYWQTRNKKNPLSFSSFIKHIDPRKLSNYRKYSINNCLVVDDVFKYEELSESLDAIRKQLNLPENITLPLTKNTVRTNRIHYTNLLTDKDRFIIENACKKEIDLLGYQY